MSARGPTTRPASRHPWRTVSAQPSASGLSLRPNRSSSSVHLTCWLSSAAAGVAAASWDSVRQHQPAPSLVSGSASGLYLAPEASSSDGKVHRWELTAWKQGASPCGRASVVQNPSEVGRRACGDFPLLGSLSGLLIRWRRPPAVAAVRPVEDGPGTSEGRECGDAQPQKAKTPTGDREPEKSVERGRLGKKMLHA